MAGKFEIKTSDKGTLSFALKAGNGEIIAVSQQYANLNACKKGINSVKRNAPIAKIEDQTEGEVITVTNPKFEVYADKKGEVRFRLKARNGQVVVTGEGYKAKAGCLKGIESIRRNAPDAEIVIID